jgi:hypothetical protein
MIVARMIDEKMKIVIGAPMAGSNHTLGFSIDRA